jgi:TonB family protein
VAKTTTSEPPPVNTPTVPVDDAPAAGAPVLRMENLGEGGLGDVTVAKGKTTKGKKGSGGSGGDAGTGTGTGTGAGTGAAPVSVASIKTRAKAKDGFDYFDAGKNYPPEARQLGVEGQIRVRLVVDERGKVTTTKLLNKLGHGLDELALDRAKKLEFHPAVDTDDRPVSSVVVWTFTFTLPA